MRTLWFVLLVPACTPSSPVAGLAGLPSPKIAGVENGFWIDYDTSVDCFELSSDVHGTVDGQPMTFTRGGWRSTPDGDVCDRIGVNFSAPLADQAVTSIELADGTTTWSFGVERLAPSAWTITAPSTVTEGSDVTVDFAPTPAGVALDWVYIAPDGVGISPYAGQPDATDTVHIDAGYWSDEDEATPGEALSATLAVELGPLAIDGCPIASCAFSTHTPDPAQPVTIAIP